MTTVSQIAKFDPFKALSKFSKWQNDLQNHLSFWPTPANVLAASRKCHARHTDEKVSGVLHLSRKQRFRPQNVPDVLRLPHDMDIAQKTSTARAKHFARQALCASARSRNAHGNLTREPFMRQFTVKMPRPRERTLI